MKIAFSLPCFLLTGCGFGVTGLLGHHGGGPTVVGTGKPISQVRKAQAVSAVEVSGALQVVIVKGSTPKLEIRAQKEILPHIKSTFKNGRLILSTEGSMITDGDMKVWITMPAVREIEASGATTVSATGLSGGEGKFDLSGASKLKASGSLKALDATLSGACEADLKSVSVGDAKIDASGASKIWIKASGHLTASASGASEIHYSGKPARVSKDATGASSITSN